MQHRITAGLVILALAMVALVPVRHAHAQTTPQATTQTAQATTQATRAASGLTVPIFGTVNSATGTLTGTFTITRFAIQNGQLVAVGTLSATLLDATRNMLQTIVRPIALPVTVMTGTCDVLHFELSPADLTLQAMSLHLNNGALDVTADAGTTLGNQLCSIASLLNASTVSATLPNLLNQIPGVMAGV